MSSLGRASSWVVALLTQLSLGSALAAPVTPPSKPAPAPKPAVGGSSTATSGPARAVAIKTAPVAVAPRSKQRPALAVAFDAQGQLYAKVCPAASCDPRAGVRVEMPSEARALVQTARLYVVRLEAGEHAVWVSIADAGRNLRWEALLGAPLQGDAPLVLFANWVGLTQGEYGLRQGAALIVSDADAQGTRRIVRGELREDLSLCQREAVLAPEVLGAADFAFHPAKIQRLSAEERARAQVLVATRIDAPPRAGVPQVLHAYAASSAVADPAYLTDGNPETSWSENRGGDGRGEFVVMRAPGRLPLSGFEFSVRPPTQAVVGGIAPLEFWLATNKELFRITMPEDAWAHPGARYRVLLNRSVQSDCVALVTEKGFGAQEASKLTFAELNGISDVSSLDVAELLRRLEQGGEPAESAKAALMALGDVGYAALAKAFAGLGPRARSAALDVLTSAPCEHSVATFVAARVSADSNEQRRASDVLQRCAELSATLLLERLHSAPLAERGLLADELSLVSPERAVTGLVELLATGNSEERRLLRVAVARATRVTAGATAARRQLDNPQLTPSAALELLRSLGERLDRFLPEAERGLTRALGAGQDFASRYLLIEPAAVLAPRAAQARAFVSAMLVHEKDARLRAKAAESVRDAVLFKNELYRATYDAEFRVRLAAVTNLGEQRVEFAGDAVAKRLLVDAWPAVRAAAARALGRFGRNQKWDAALATSLADDAPVVRRAVLLAVGARGLQFLAPKVRERLEDDEEWPNVRAAAAEALGALCDLEAADLLTEHALKLSDPYAGEAAREVGPAALRALVALGPTDLKQRLKPLLSARVDSTTRGLLGRLIAKPGTCRRQR